MRPLCFVLLMAASLSIPAIAQEQVAVRLNEKGILKILEMGLKYNTATKEQRTFVVPQNIYKFTLPKNQLSGNPIVEVVNEISDLNLKKDLDFYLHTNDIKITGNVDQKSLRAQIFNSTANGFDLRLNLSLPSVTVQASSLSLCEDKMRNRNQCGNGLKATVSNARIVTRGRAVSMTAVLRLRTDGNVARLKVISVDSNLEGRGAPTLDINIGSVVIPRVAIVIDGQETELDTSRLSTEIMQRRDLLGAKLLSFAADFIASDVAEMINVYLVNKTIATSYQVIQSSKPTVKFDEFLSLRNNFAVRDGTYVRPSVIHLLRANAHDPVKTMMGQIADVLKNAQFGISLQKISTPQNKDIELAGLINFILNGRRMNIRNTLGNSSRTLPALDLSSERSSDVNLAISEPVINGALDLVNTTGLYQDLFEQVSSVKGFTIKSVKVHFTAKNTVVAVVNAQIDLKKLHANSIKSWIKNKIAVFLERNNNNSVIYFPIQVEINPRFTVTTNKVAGMSIFVKSPFGSNNSLVNTYKYPTNIPNMTDTVREGVMEELKDSLLEHVNKNYDIDLSKFLNQGGVEFIPRKVAINQSSYLMINLDIGDIKFSAKNPNGGR
jgi:hypothetical protein